MTDRGKVTARGRERGEETRERERRNDRERRLLYTASFYVHRKNAKQACTSTHTSRVRVHTGNVTEGGGGRMKEEEEERMVE